jgi:hypothetical protein
MRVYQFVRPSIVQEIALGLAELQDELPEYAHSRFNAMLMNYAKLIATHFVAESCTIFLFRPPHAPRMVDREEVEERSPRTLLPFGYFGFPQELFERESFTIRGDHTKRGVVIDVIESGASQVFDFRNPDTRARVRAANYQTYSKNSRFFDDARPDEEGLQNGVIVPIRLGLCGPATTAQPEAYGALRVLNCFHPTADGKMELTDSAPSVRELQAIAEEIAALYQFLQTRTRLDLLHASVEGAAAISTPRDYIEAVLNRAKGALDFDHVVVRTPGQDEMVMAHYAGIQRKATKKSLPRDRSYSGRAFDKGGTLDIAAERGSDSPEASQAGSPPAHLLPSTAQNGYVIRIDQPGGDPWGTVEFLDARGAPHRSQSLDDRAMCESLAALMGVKVSISQEALEARADHPDASGDRVSADERAGR